MKENKKTVFSVRINKELVKSLKKLAVDEDKRYGELLEEAIKLLLEKYKEKEEKRNEISR